MFDALRRHWREYCIEALLLGTFMVSACAFATLLEHPASPVRAALPDAFARRALMGAAMGLTALVLLTSRLGKRSGAHMNPAVTLAFWTMRRVDGRDAAWYALFQCAGAILGVLLCVALLPRYVKDPSVHYVATVPGAWGRGVAFAGEIAISFCMLLAILAVSNARVLTRFTPIVAGTLVAAWITFEAPLSGMSMNPARTLGSALSGGVWDSVWIYLTAPPLGMFLASRAFVALRGLAAVRCAKIHHRGATRCIFHCAWDHAWDR